MEPIIKSKSELIKISVLFVTLVVVATAIIYAIPQIHHSESEFNYTGNVTDIEFLGSAAHPQTLVRFDDRYVLLFRRYEINIPLNEEVIFYYHDNVFGHLFLDKFKVIK